MTLTDPSEEMLVVSRGLNPECEHLVGDMRALPLENCSQAVYFGLYDFSGSTGGLVGIHSSPAKTADGANVVIQARTA